MNKEQYFPIRYIFLMAVWLLVTCDNGQVEELKQPAYRDAFLGDYKFKMISHELSRNTAAFPFPFHFATETDYDGHITASGTEGISICISEMGCNSPFKGDISSLGTIQWVDQPASGWSLGKGYFRNDSVFFELQSPSAHNPAWVEYIGAKKDDNHEEVEEPESDDSGLMMDCRPVSYKIPRHYVNYSYNGSNQVSKISISGEMGSWEHYFEYNASGQLAHVRRPTTSDDYELIYDGQPKPQKIQRTWGSITATYDLSYDAEGRLIRRGSSINGGPEYASFRYEYGDDSNVVRSYFKLNDKESLQTDNFVFDNKPRFYKDHPELETFYITILGGTPGKNNVLSYDFHYDGYITFDPPKKVTYKVGYNSIGLIKNCEYRSTSSSYGIVIFEFLQMAYECK